MQSLSCYLLSHRVEHRAAELTRRSLSHSDSVVQPGWIFTTFVAGLEQEGERLAVPDIWDSSQKRLPPQSFKH